MANAGTSDPTSGGGLATEQDAHDQDRRPAALDANFWAVFDSAPDAYLLLAPDPPRFTMVTANEARLRVTMTRREDVVGRPLFAVCSSFASRDDSSRGASEGSRDVLPRRATAALPRQYADETKRGSAGRAGIRSRLPRGGRP
jgi:hypothetical protein